MKAKIAVATSVAGGGGSLPGKARGALEIARRLATRRGGGFDMALGLAKHGVTKNAQLLNRFAAHVNAKTYGQLQGTWWPGSMEKLETTLTSFMRDADRLHFNLDQFDMVQFRQFAANPSFAHLNVANWELHTILTSPSLLQKTTFYGPGGTVVPAPSIR